MSTSDARSAASPDPIDDPNVKEQGWMLVDPGSSVVTADGDEVGTIRELTPHYVQVRAKRNVLSDVEMYIPNDIVEGSQDGQLRLMVTKAALEEMDLTTPPALKQ